MRTLAIAGWAVILTALFTWQTLGLLHGPEWPTMSDMLRALMRTPVARWALFGAWLWIGWHVFIRGWELFLGERL